MRQLLKIESVPAKIQIQSVKARLDIQSSRPKLNIIRKKNGINIKTQPAEISISSKGLRDSIPSMKSTLTLMKEHAAEGLRVAEEAIGNIVETGNQMANNKTTSIADIAANSFIPMMESGLQLVPHNPIEISFSEPNIDINYIPDEIQYEWQTGRPQGKYTPYEVNINVVSYPKVNIEYIGEPQYFPHNPSLLEQQLEEYKAKV